MAKYVIYPWVLWSLVLSCGGEVKVQYVGGETDFSEQDNPRVPIDAQLIQVPITFRQQENLTLLADATTFSISLDSCATGLTATVDETSNYLEVYEFDRDCLAKLTQFTLNSKTYTPKAGSVFDTWQAGDIATFEVNAASPADELTVEVIETLGSPISSTDAIHYEFSEITDGGDQTIGEPTVRESAELSVDGQAAPDFTVNQIELVGITANGNGEFRFQLECNQAVTGTGNDITCFDVRLDSIYLAMGTDTYGGSPSVSDLETMFTAFGGGSQVDMSTEAFVAGGGSPVLTNGGFITADTGDADVMVLPGSAPMHSNANMIFALKSGPSYLYFNVDVTTIVQSGDGP
ncbi:hypothetical protein [Pseudobacteriovorax antillogorgiicola]|uniref:DUF4382 domain-containing protein n=1 Tax=Pseudobacteriovorax antillogorgiicola TaxID=1513793 RepID=A0A1Y6BLV4_9BACT|nr:hypothetical protein [Pseudobacteriovorax antillogorgiicola]TCS54556.1 hypothetical protein EDD56_10669 [Pseudobacteriovorax antillogorgiicola]SMF18400.1 hypothetical protein SAMN06296036_106174 [Pseudobacteriovorax antillogorgiicola]